MPLTKSKRRAAIHKRVRRIVKGTAERPRLVVFRSNMEIYAQLIDDKSGKTLLGHSSKDMKNLSGNKVAKSKEVGIALAKTAAEKGISSVVFDRGGYLYHGRVKALAEGAREGGLQF